MIEIRQVEEFVREHNLEMSHKLLKYLLVIGIDTVQNQARVINSETIKLLAKRTKRTGTSQIKSELQQIKHEIERLSKNLETNMQPHIVPKKSEDYNSWFYSPQKSDPLPPNANNSYHKIKKTETQQLTPKVTESPAPSLAQFHMPPRPNNFKHHLDDSEMYSPLLNYFFQRKKALWSQREPQQPCNQVAQNSRSNIFASVNSNTDRTVQSQSIEQSCRQSSPKFKINESSQSEQKNIQTSNVPVVKQSSKENQNPQQASKKKKRQRKLSNKRKDSQVPNYLRNVQSKIKEQIVQDKNDFRQEREEAKSIGQSQATFKRMSELSEQLIDDIPIPESESQCQTILPSELKQMMSSRNPLNSLNTKPANYNEGFEDFFQSSSKQQPEYLNQRHQRYISQAFNSSSENTPFPKQKQSASSISLLSSSNNKQIQSSEGRAGFIETNKKPINQLETSNKMIDIANSFLNSPFVKQLCTEGNTKPRLFKGLSSCKEKGRVFQEKGQFFKELSDNQSLSSSNFSLFNPKDELKSMEGNDKLSCRFLLKRDP